MKSCKAQNVSFNAFQVFFQKQSKPSFNISGKDKKSHVFQLVIALPFCAWLYEVVKKSFPWKTFTKKLPNGGQLQLQVL